MTQPPKRQSATQSLRRAMAGLKRHDCPGTDPIREAGLFLSLVTGKTPAELATDPDMEITDRQAAELENMVARRINHEPVELIVGFADFRGLRLRVTADTLIPRPATEALVEAALCPASAGFGGCGGQAPRRRNDVLTVDVGTGSGAIALAMTAESESAGRIIGTDESAEAVAVARTNADSLGMNRCVEFRKGDLLTPVADLLLRHGGPIAIIANLPYIPEGKWADLPPEIRNFEPKTAIVSGPDGLNHYRRLLEQLKTAYPPGGIFPDSLSIYLEILPEQHGPLAELVSLNLPRLKTEPLRHGNGQTFGLKATGRITA